MGNPGATLSAYRDKQSQARSILEAAKLVRSSPLAAGIEFREGDQTFRCWVWGNAVTLADD